MKKQKLLLATGGTGGHIFPALALKNYLESKKFVVKVAADSKFAKFHSFDADHMLIPSANFANKSPLAILNSLFTLLKGFIRALWIMKSYNPDVVIGFGGYASYPTMIAAIILRKKIILHEANTVLGKVNRVILPWAKYLSTGFETIEKVQEKYKSKIVFIGNPVREDIIKSSKEKRKTMKDNFSILIIGGSQGAKVFSKIIPDAIINLPEEVKSKLFIHQQVKDEDIEAIKERYNNEKIKNEIKSFFNNMPEILSRVDLVIARAGASTISEIIQFNLPTIFIPYPYAADNHQYYNAKEIVSKQAGWLIKESADAHIQLLQTIKLINQDPLLLKNAAKNLKNLTQDACKNIENLIDDTDSHS